ncbi:MAG TPA: YgjP-like metallopeptidase domain-containing protein [Gallionellaceae bacterium]|nr:YgjP-like metallopeptidase domain-containing protein [Gallionellaceae bacterium]
MKYLASYPLELQEQVQQLIDEQRLGAVLQQKYPGIHEIQSDGALYRYVQALKSAHMRTAAPLSKVIFDADMRVLDRTLGTHTVISRVQGQKLKAKNEMRISVLFKQVPEAFLRMIVVHELAHLREKLHNKAFYKLCLSMEPAYLQLEFDLRLYLTHLDQFGALEWQDK